MQLRVKSKGRGLMLTTTANGCQPFSTCAPSNTEVLLTSSLSKLSGVNRFPSIEIPSRLFFNQAYYYLERNSVGSLYLGNEFLRKRITFF